MKNEKHLSQLIYKILPALLILFLLFILHTAVLPETAWAKNLLAPRMQTGNQDDFDKDFRVGRDLIDLAEWAKAAEKFSEVTQKYPDNKSVDAALYWLAFCYKKQKQFAEANLALDRLIEKFSASSWVSDARVMRLEIGTSLGGFYPAIANTIIPTGGVSGLPAPAAAINFTTGNTARRTQNLYESLTFGGVAASETRAPLDRQDEIKIAAFQSLLAADAKRAINAMGEILKPDSKASETLKLEILRVLRSPRMLRAEALSLSASKTAGGEEFAPLLRETLVKAFEREPNLKIRQEIIYSMVSLGEQSTDYLKKLYAAAGDDRETKRAIINSFGNSASGFYYFTSAANNFYGYRTTNGAQNRKNESGFLLEIVRDEKDAELRSIALSNLQRFTSWAADEQTIETLARLYDSDTDEKFKIGIVRAFSSAKQIQATRKLLDIAKSDKSDKLKLEAIYSLRNSKDPEVLKFLESLLK